MNEKMMEKNNKILYRTAQSSNRISTITNFISSGLSTPCTPREAFRTRLELRSQLSSNRKTDDFTNDTERNYLSVKKEPLRSNQDKHFRNASLMDEKCHQHTLPRTNYFEEGKIIHRDVDWITYNIVNCMVSLWLKNQRNFQQMNKRFSAQRSSSAQRATFAKKSQNSPKFEEFTSSIKHSKTLQNPKKINHLQGVNGLNFLNLQFSQIDLGSDQNHEKAVKNIMQLIFQNKFYQNQASKQSQKDFLSLNDFRKAKKHSQTNQNSPYKYTIEQKSSQILSQITSRNEKLYPLLIDLSRKILVKKENKLIEKILKNQKLHDFYLDTLGFQEKVQLFQKILIRRMDDFKILKEHFFKIGKSTQIELQEQEKLISECVSKGLFKFHNNKILFSEGKNLNQSNPFTDGKKIIRKSAGKKDEQKQNIHFFTNSELFQNKVYQSRINNGFGLKNVDIKFNNDFDGSQEPKLKTNGHLKKKKSKNERCSLPHFDQHFQADEQLTKVSQKGIIKSINSINNLKDSNKNKGESQNSKTDQNLLKIFQSDKNMTNANLTEQNHEFLFLKKNETHEKLKQSHISTNNKNHYEEQTPWKKYENKNLLKDANRKNLVESSNKKNFLKNKRKGIKISPYKTKQFLKFLHAKNRSKFNQSQTESQIIRQQQKEKAKAVTQDNSPAKTNKNEYSNSAQKTKPLVSFNMRKEKKQSQRKVVKKRTQRRRTIKLKENGDLTHGGSQVQTKTMSRLKRLKFQNLIMIPHNVIEMIIHQRPQIDKEMNSIVLREKLIAYFNRLLESGALDHGELAKYKQEVETLIRNYDYKRKTMSVKKNLASAQKEKVHPHKMLHQKNNDNKIFNINVKVRHDDPYIFQRLKQIHLNLKQNKKSSLQQVPIFNFNNDQLKSQINQFEQNYRSERRNSNIELDLQFSDFFSPVRTKFEDQFGVKEAGQMRNIHGEEHNVIDFMKKFIQKSFLALGQKNI